jgi:hypothetical protein
MLKKTMILFGFFLLLMMACNAAFAQDNSGTVNLHFYTVANQKPLLLNDSVYWNDFGESYRISKLKYYVGNFVLDQKSAPISLDKYFLVDANQTTNDVAIQLTAGTYHSLQFKLGVDSIDNCSGAQTGALDPLNSMFWTWNSGYIFFKLEGNSAASNAPDGRIEHHIGGYKDAMNVASDIFLSDTIVVEAGKTTNIFIELNLDRYWNAIAKIKINAAPICMSPGSLAKTIASNFKSLFSIKSKSISN